MSINELAFKAWNNPQTNYWFISPTFSQAKDLYRRLKSSLPSECVLESLDTELRIELLTKSVIEFKSGEALENLRGKTLHGVIIDEVRDQHPELWPMVIRPMLTTTKGWAAFVSTPNGFDSFYDLVKFAETNPEEWDVFKAPSTCNPLFTQSEFLSAKKTMGEAQFAQEILAEFRDLSSGKVYVSHGDWNKSIKNPLSVDGLLHPMLPIVVAMDFNLSPLCFVLGQKRIDNFHWFDELCVHNTYTQEHAELLAQKILALNHKPGIIIIGDASGKSNKTSSAGKSDYDIICQIMDKHKIPWINMTPESNPTIKDRINTVNASLRDASGTTHLTYNPSRCLFLGKDFDRVVWKMSSNSERITEDQTKDPDLTHASSAVGYAICALSPLQYNQEVGTLKIIRR
jgi:Terminase large subunit, T4likevirus-type, N-terminal